MKNLESLGKFISLILRHSPDTIGIALDGNGWADVDELIKGINKKGKFINITILNEIVETNNKKRYEFSEDHKRIRACQGHSINVNVELEVATPPKILYHGTATKNIDSIKKLGIKKLQRQYVHLSEEIETAYNVGKRYGKPYIIKVLAKKMHDDKIIFYKSKNNVWLTDNIQTKYLIFED